MQETTLTPTREATAIDLLAWLLAKRYLLNTGFVVNDVLATIGATRDDLDDALFRLEQGRGLRMPVFEQRLAHGINLPSHPFLRSVPDVETRAPSGGVDAIPDAPTPTPEPTAAPPAPPKPPKRKQKPSRVRPTGIGPLGETTLLCTGPCGAWLPTDSFTPRSDRPGIFTARCKECRRLYMSSRHVKVATLEALDALGVKFHLDDGSNIVGLACANCGEPFKPGDDIHGTVNDLAHDVCPSGG